MEFVTLPLLALIGVSTITNILIVAAGLSLVVFFHELGHFFVAKWCGVYVERFSMGLMHPIISKKWGETEYAVGWLPFGGYVKMRGQDDMDPGQMTDEEIAKDPRSYTNKTVLQRMAIISAGVIMNLITGFLFFSLAFTWGIRSIDGVVGSVQVGMPAWQNGIRPGDRLTSVAGRDINEFSDVFRGTTLSRGPIVIQGVHEDGETYEVTLEPEKPKTRRMIGAGPSAGLSIVESMTAWPGTAASHAEFQPGDTITAINGTPVNSHQELLRVLDENAASSVDVAVERTTDDKTTQASVLLPAEKFLGFGFKLGMGRVVGMQDGSPAEAAGFKEGDRIAKVAVSDSESESGVKQYDVETDLDPVRLTEFFSQHHGENVVVTVTREVEGSAPETKELKVTPLDRMAWAEPPTFEGSPLSIPSIGLAYQLVPTVFYVDPGSPAEGQEIERRDTITQIEFLKSPGTTEQDGVAEDVLKLDISKGNWPFAFWAMQENGRTRNFRLTIKPAEGETTRTVDITPVEYNDWYVPTTRGLLLGGLEVERKAENYSEALAMAGTYTRNSIEDIYLTLRGLFTGDISPKLLSGPIGIADLAYKFAKLGMPYFVLFLGMISINLAVINFLPLLPLDGGHMVLLIWEGVTFRKPNEKLVTAAINIGVLFVMTLMLIVIYMDIFVPKE